MKSIIKFILAAIAISLALTSCAKELLIEENGSSSPSEGTRVIVVSFGQQTKTALNADGITPEFTGEDEWVMVSNEETGEKCQIITENGVLLFKTNLKGELRAVYPASAAKIDKKTNKITGITIPATQTGKFADANICLAENITNKAVFDNKTAILKFYVGEEISVNEISITGSKITEGSKTITVSAPDGKHLHEVTDGPDKRICYVAVQAGVQANGLQLKSKTTTQGDIGRTLTTAATLEAGKMYNAFIPYYIEVNGVKWGYCNVGAFLPEEPGEYFAWGETIGHKWNASENKFDNGYNFNWANTPFNGANASFDQTYFNTTKDIVCPNGTLALKYDAANANWGNGWRLPTKGDFETLKSKATFDNSSSPAYIFKSESKSVFFPAAGYATPQMYYSDVPYYWSSTLGGSSYEKQAYMLFADNRAVNIGERNVGMPIRPVYDETAILQQSVLLPGEFTVDENGNKVRFTGGNLYWKDNNWYVEKNQWDYHLRSNGHGSFYFNPSAEKAMAGTFDSEGVGANSKLFCHEDTPLAIGGETGFFALTSSEWQYLSDRKQTNKYARARVNDGNGLLIFPDGYCVNTQISDITGISAVNNGSWGDFPSSNIDSGVWSLMLSNGVVFLPITGSYSENGSYKQIWNSEPGRYWNSNADANGTRKEVLFNTTQVQWQWFNQCQETSASIRLVKRKPTAQK